MNEENGKGAVLVVMLIGFMLMFLFSSNFDNCRDAFMDGGNVVWHEGIPACHVEVNIDGETKRITPMQWYRFVYGDK